MVRYALAGNMLAELSRNWWVLVVRGVAAVIFGVLALVWPAASLIALAIIFGAFALVDGVVLAFTAFRAGSGNRMPLGVQAGLSIALGLMALIWPMAAVIALVFLIGAWAIVTGVAEIVTAVRLRAQISSEWLLIFVGALSVIFGLLVWFWPLAGAQVIMWVVGAYAIVFGVVMAAAGFRLRGAADGFSTREEQAMAADAEDFGGAGEPGDRGEPTAETGTEPADEERPVSAFDEGYAGGYSDGYRGDQRDTDQIPEVAEDETAAPRAGRHRAQKERPDDPGTL
ncbi:HdeD family acid-resistance protein [Nocardiopsis exhalans]|uniref:HdeD family acid-resistance protein n=1 Tax=Nocardiopsis exhalans TaxID=163604 RepID=A0ABY5D8W4_9ACTN|nr:HdeD family acid-resistance protein [Nocardiopsis exhalans]USY20777.1 HdeD family acid-resistance protein [Nocardiopsis exhalans]